MHIAHFIHRYPPALGGSEAYFARLGNYLAHQGDTVSVFTSTAVELEALWRRGHAETSPGTQPEGHARLRVSRFRPLHFPGRRYLLKALSLVPVPRWQCLTQPCNPVCPGMWRAADRFAGPLDAVHATAFPYAFPILCGLRLARRRGVPLVVTPFLHLGDSTDRHDRTRRQYTAPHLQWLLQQADCVFVQTRLERDAVRELGIPDGRIVLQGLGVAAAECTGGNRAIARTAWGAANSEVLIGHLANNSREKGTIDLLQAAAVAWAAGERFRVVLAGAEMPNFRAFWNGFAHQERVVRLGPLSEAARREFFAGIDLFALPSRSDSFGLVLVEAWANARPNLVYRAGGPAELVRDGVDGLHARCGDIPELATKLGELVRSEELRHRMGAAGHARLPHEFEWSAKLDLVREAMARLNPQAITQRNNGSRPSPGKPEMAGHFPG